MDALGVAELLIFHPVDTIAKRLMSNKSKASLSTLNTVIFRDHASSPIFRKLFSLFPGLGYAAGYKIAQRIYKFGGQPYFNDVIRRTPVLRSFFENSFGERNSKMMMHAAAGSLTGIGEVVLLPLDALKIKRQVNPEAFKGRGFVRIFLEEGTTLYRGWGWTMARNAPGSFAVWSFHLYSNICWLIAFSSYSVHLQLQRIISLEFQITQKLHGLKILLLRLLEQLHLSQSRHLLTPSRLVFKMLTLRPRFLE